jgi:hypothetical protein
MQLLSTLDATSLTASVGTATATTVSSLLPIVYMVGGLVLGFIVIRFIISAIKSTGGKKA